MRSKRELAIRLSSLSTFKDPSLRKEQYPTDAEIAAHLLWNAHMLEDINDRLIHDLGSGTGILGIGSLLLGARATTFIDYDEEAQKIAAANLESEGLSNRATLVTADISSIQQVADTIIMNPPFGAQQRHADRAFLQAATRLAPCFYSIHNANSEQFLHSFLDDAHYSVTHRWIFEMPLKQTFRFHRKKIHRQRVIAIRAMKKPQK